MLFLMLLSSNLYWLLQLTSKKIPVQRQQRNTIVRFEICAKTSMHFLRICDLFLPPGSKGLNTRRYLLFIFSTLLFLKASHFAYFFYTASLMQSLKNLIEMLCHKIVHIMFQSKCNYIM